MTDVPALAPIPAPPPPAAPQATVARPPRALKTNFAINVAGALVPLAVSLVTVPIYIRHIGDARYGVLSIVWVLLGYLGFLDFGLSRAAVRALARLKDAPQAERARVLVTTLALNLGLGLLGSLVLASLGSYLLQHVLAVPEALKPEIARALPWIVVLFPLALVGGVGIGTLESRERFGMANVLGVGGTAAGQILPVILAVAVGPSLAIVIPAAVVVRGLTVLVVLFTIWRQERPLSWRHVDRTKAKELFSYGSWLTVSGVISPVLVSLDQFVIGSMVGVSAVTFYAVPMNLVIRTQVFPSALARTVFPRLASLSTGEARCLASKSLNVLSSSYGLICGPAIILAPTFLDLWVGPDFSRSSALVVSTLFLGSWINASAFVPFELLQSQGRSDVTGKLHLAELLPYVTMLCIFTYYFGILGAAISWTARVTLDCACLLFAAGMPMKMAKMMIWPLSTLVFAMVLSYKIGSNLTEATLAAATLTAVSLGITAIQTREIWLDWWFVRSRLEPLRLLPR